MQQSDETGERKTDRKKLVDEWLRHFGVNYPEELDLGTLEAIGQLVRDGCPPPLKQLS